MSHLHLFLAAGVLTLLAHGSAAAGGDHRIGIVAVSGDLAPGANGAAFRQFWAPQVSNSGHIAFCADQMGPDVGPPIDGVADTGIWSKTVGESLQLVTRVGNVAPGTDGTTFSLLDDPLVNDAGHLLFVGVLDSYNDPNVSGLNDTGLWSAGITSDLDLVVREADSVPHLDGARFGPPSRYEIGLSNSDRIAFEVGLFGTHFGDSLWVLDDGHLHLLARRDDTAPGTNGETFYGFEGIRIGASGEISFVGNLTTPGNDNPLRTEVWTADRNDDLTLVALEGQQAPGTDIATFWEFNGWGLESPTVTGEIAFLADLYEPGVSYTNRGIWSERGVNGLQLVARRGDPVPGLDGLTFSNLRHLRTNDVGHVAFWGTLAEAEANNTEWVDSAVWIEGDGNDLEMIARGGDLAPGTPGARFAQLFAPGARFRMNNNGQIAFHATVEGDGISNANDNGIWATDRNGVLRLIIREGEVLDVEEGPEEDLRTIAFFKFDSFNDRGQVPFVAYFTDGTSGIFVSDIAAIPEPRSLGVLSVLVLILHIRQLRHERLELTGQVIP